MSLPMNLARVFCVLPFMLLTAAASADPAPERIVIDDARYKALIGERAVTFIVMDSEAGREHCLNCALAASRFPPHSTFKIPNAVIALETGVASGPDFVIPYDAKKNPPKNFWPKDWAQDQTLASAFKRSAIWAYQALARRIGEDAYRAALAKYGYGNEDISAGVDQFWLSSSLKISPQEQIAFLRGLREGKFGVSEKTLRMLDAISTLESANGYTLHGKTGTGPLDRPSSDDPLLAFTGRFGGWLVGWVDRPDKKPAYFALYAEGPDFPSIAKFRGEMARRLLADLGFSPESFAQPRS